MRWVGHVTSTEKKRNAHLVLVGKDLDIETGSGGMDWTDFP
jgi:hypothetical protein